MVTQENVHQNPPLRGSENPKVGEHTEVPAKKAPFLPMMVNLPSVCQVSPGAGGRNYLSFAGSYKLGSFPSQIPATPSWRLPEAGPSGTASPQVTDIGSRESHTQSSSPTSLPVPAAWQAAWGPS